MCLTRSIEKEKLSKISRDNLKNGIGYKVFTVRPLDKKLSTTTWIQYTYKKNKWMHDENVCWLEYEHTYSKRYETGFHIFLTKTAAKTWMRIMHCSYDKVIHKIKFKNVVQVGQQNVDEWINNREDYKETILCVAVVKDMIIKEEVNIK